MPVTHSTTILPLSSSLCKVVSSCCHNHHPTFLSGVFDSHIILCIGNRLGNSINSSILILPLLYSSIGKEIKRPDVVLVFHPIVKRGETTTVVFVWRRANA